MTSVRGRAAASTPGGRAGGWRNTPMAYWSQGDVHDWLRTQLPPALYQSCAQQMLTNHVSGRVLVDLDEEDLIRMHIESAEDRYHLLHKIGLEALRDEWNELTALRKQL